MDSTRSTLMAVADRVSRSGYAGRESKALRKVEAGHAEALEQLVAEAEAKATALVGDYRAAAAKVRETHGRSALTETQLRVEYISKTQADRALGGIDALHALFPDLAAWKDTKWTE